AVPHVDGGAGDDIPIRDFDTSGMGWLPGKTRSSMDQCRLLLATTADRPPGGFRAAEALDRVRLGATLAAYPPSRFTRVIEVPHQRYLLRTALGLDMNPHVLLRIGHAPKTPASRRRRLVDVLSESA